MHPAFRAGVESWERFRASRACLLNTLDQLDQAVIVIDRDGRVATRRRGSAHARR
jgi:hypothetical protein